MKIKTAEATGLQLDWGLAVAVGREPSFVFSEGKLHHIQPQLIGGGGWYSSYNHADAAVCMGLIKEYRMDIDQVERYPDVWVGAYFSDESFEDKDSAGYVAETLEMAVARCVIAMRLGDEFECPDELGVMS